MTRLVLSLGGGNAVTDEKRAALEQLGAELAAKGGFEFRVESNPLPGAGVIFGEVVVIYFASKVIDRVTDNAVDRLMDRAIEVGREFARRRVQQRIDQGMKRGHVHLRRGT